MPDPRSDKDVMSEDDYNLMALAIALQVVHRDLNHPARKVLCRIAEAALAEKRVQVHPNV